MKELLSANARERRKWLTLIFGRRKRRDAGVPRTPQGWTRKLAARPPAYSRVSAFEIERFRKLRDKGKSMRSIGRSLHRSHHTVSRWLLRVELDPSR